MQMIHVDQCTDTSTCVDCGVNIAADRKCLWNSIIFNLPPGLVNITLFNEMVIQPLANWITVNTSNVSTSCCKVAPEPEAFPEGGLTCRIISSHHHCNSNNIQQRQSRRRTANQTGTPLHISRISYILDSSWLFPSSRSPFSNFLSQTTLETPMAPGSRPPNLSRDWHSLQKKYCESEYRKIISMNV